MTVAGALASFAVVAGLMTLTPGLDTALVLRTAALRGRRAGAAAALGINTGVLLWALAAAVGISALLTASEVAYTALRWLGVGYMVWLGVGMLRSAVSGHGAGEDTAPGDEQPRSTWSWFRQGLVVNLTNPKIGVFYVALLPNFIPRGHSAALMGLLLGLVHNAEGLLWFGVLIAAVHRMRAWLRTPAAQRWIDGVAGTAVIGFAARIALERR